MPLFLVDECVSKQTTLVIEKLGYSVYKAESIGLKGAKDDVIFRTKLRFACNCLRQLSGLLKKKKLYWLPTIKGSLISGNIRLLIMPVLF